MLFFFVKPPQANPLKQFAMAESLRFQPMRWLDSWKYGQMIRSLASGCFGEEGTGTG